MRRPALAAALLASVALGPGSCKKSADAEPSSADQAAQVGKICDGMNDLSLAYVAGIMEIEVETLDAPGKRAELVTACKTMPLDVARCADRLAIDDAKCDAALEKFLGMTDSKPQGEGPTPSWELGTPFEIYDIEVGPGGRVAIAGEDEIAVVDGGEVKWRAKLEDASARLSWWKEQVLTADGSTLRAYDAEGKEAWSKSLGTEDTRVSAIEPGPQGAVTMVTRDGEIIRVDPDACAAGGEGCTTSVSTVESLGGMVVEVLDGGALLGSGDTLLVLVSAKGERLAERAADYDAGVSRAGVVVQNEDVLKANPGCTAGSDDCFEVLASAKDLELVAPLQLDGALVYADTYGVIVSTGAHEWKIDAGNDSDLLSDGTTIYSVGHALGFDAMDAPPQVRAIEPKSGTTQWITTLGTERASLLSGPLVELHDDRLIVATKSQLFEVPLGKG